MAGPGPCGSRRVLPRVHRHSPFTSHCAVSVRSRRNHALNWSRPYCWLFFVQFDTPFHCGNVPRAALRVRSRASILLRFSSIISDSLRWADFLELQRPRRPRAREIGSSPLVPGAGFVMSLLRGGRITPALRGCAMTHPLERVVSAGSELRCKMFLSSQIAVS